jgi:hypothetical protein
MRALIEKYEYGVGGESDKFFDSSNNSLTLNIN